MKKKLCALICTIAVLSSMCVPIASADGGFTFTQSFDDVVLEDGTTDLGAVSEAIGLDVTVSNSYFPNEVDGRFAFTKTADGKLKIVGTNIKIGTGLTIAKDLAEPVKIGIITLDVSLSEIKEDGESQWRAARLYDSVNNKWTQRTDLTTGTNAYKFHVVYSRTSEDEPWKEERTITAISATGTESTTTTTKEYTATGDFNVCTSVRPLESYLYDGNASIVVDDVHIEVTRLPVVKSDDDGLTGAEPFAEDMTVGFDTSLPDPTDKVTFVKKDDADVIIETQTQYDEATARLTVKPLSFLAYGTKYTLKFANGGVANYTFETKAAPVKVVSKTYTYTRLTPTAGTPGGEIPQEGTFKAEASIKVANATDAPKKVDVIFVAYDENGAIVDSMPTQVSIPENTPEGYPVPVELSGLSAGEALRFEAFVFESSPKGGYLPLV